MLFDSHCHLDDARLLPRLPQLLAQARAAGVTGFLVPGVAPSGWPRIAELCRTFPHVYPAFGIHPMHAELLNADTLLELRRLCPFARAIGEIGLDYTLASPGREPQRRAFRAQLQLAVETRLPVLIHCRQAFSDLLSLLCEVGQGRLEGVVHAFSGSPESADACLRLGLHISLAGSVTYRNARRPPAVAARVPLLRLLLETDAPDLAPEPHRGSVNLPVHLLEIAVRIAALRDIPLEELALATTANARRLFRLGARTE